MISRDGGAEHWIAYLGEPTIEGNHVLDSQEDAEHYRNNGWTVEGPFVPGVRQSDDAIRLREAMRVACAMLYETRPRAMDAAAILSRALDPLGDR